MSVPLFIKTSIPVLVLGIAASAWARPMQNQSGNGQSDRGARFQQLMQQRRDDSGRPVILPAGARELKNVAYGSEREQVLDVYIPSDASHAPIIFMVHGGGWRRGDKASYNVIQNKINYFLPKGYIFVSTNYRMVPEVGVMAEAADVATALAYVQQHAANWGGDSARLIVMGHSAGAHLVMLLTSVPALREAAGVKPWRATVALDSAGYNIVKIMSGPHFRLYDPVFGTHAELWKEASPTLQLKSAPPVPVLLVCSTMRANSCDQATAYADKASGLGGHVKVVPLELRHQQINADVGLPGPLTDDIVNFITAQGIH